MFFWLSKLFWFVAAPSNLIGLVLAVAAMGFAARRARLARRLLFAGVAAYLLCGFGPVAGWLMRPLEDRFARPAADAPAPDAIIVLGGGMDEATSEARHALILNDAGSRMTEGVALALRYPAARLVFTGGSARFRQDGVSEASIAQRLFVALGVPPERITLETRSRNTYENAIFTRDLLQPKPGERFLLVTSAFHMTRAMGVFRRAGLTVQAWPADYTTSGTAADFWRPSLGAGTALKVVDLAAKEWVGLVAYRIAGMTDALLPAP